MKRRNHRVEGFRKLIPYLSENHKEKILHEVIQTVNKIEDNFYQATVLTDLIPYMPEKLKETLLDDILQAAQLTRLASFPAVQVLLWL